MRIHSFKLLFLITSAAAAAAGGCSALDRSPAVDIKPDDDIVAALPFPVKDPERFSADVSVKTFAGKEVVERRYFIAANKEKKLQRFGIGSADEFAVLITGNGSAYRLDAKNKVYERLEPGPLLNEPNTLLNSLTSRWLNEKRRSGFKDLGLENGLRKYQAEIEGSRNTLILIYIDEKLKFPVKQEFYRVAGDSKEISFSIELTSITTEPDDALFVIPDGYRNAGAQ